MNGITDRDGDLLAGATGSENLSKFAQKYPLFMKGALLGLWFLGLFGVLLAVRGVQDGALGQDAHAYWLAAQGELVYDRIAGERDAYLYSPVFLTFVRPLALLPWPFFLAAWICLLSLVLVWLVRPLHWKWSIPIFLFCLSELVVSNIFVLLAAATVIGLRRPEAWAFPILTKVTTGVGLLWFAFRGEWRYFWRGVGGTMLIVAVSYALEPATWHAWINFLTSHHDGTRDGPLTFALRCLMAVAIVAVAARNGWPWLIPLATVLSLAVLVSYVALTLLVAVPRLMVDVDPPTRRIRTSLPLEDQL